MGSGNIPMTGSQSSNPGTAIPDNNPAGVTVTMNVTDNFSITDLDVNLNISHTFVGDVIVTIKSPAGTTAIIVDRPGRTTTGFGCGGDNIVASLDDEAVSAVENECAPSVPTINGSFTPNNPLSIFDGESTLGIWELIVSDNVSTDTGTINSWGIDFDYELSSPILNVTLDGTGNATVSAEDLLYSVTVPCGSYTVLAGNPLAATVNFTCADIGIITVPVEVTNDNGATSTCLATVNVIGGGGGGPFVCPGDITQNNDVGICGAIVIYTVDMPSGCGGGSGSITQTAGLTSGSIFPVGTTTNTFEYSDGINPVQTCSFDVIINDLEVPAAVCQNITVQLDVNGIATIAADDIDGGSTDNCSIDTITIDNSNFTCANVGTNNVLLTVTDANGNFSTCTAIVTVEDNIAPTAVCQDITVQLDATGNVSITAADIDGGSTDACGIDTVVIDMSDFTCAEIGPNNITLTVTDVNGNTSSCVAVVTVEDDLPPTIACPADIIVNTDAGICSAVVTFPMPFVLDNCNANAIQTGGLPSGTAFPVGVNNVEFTATDGSGNTAVCSFTITVEDNEAPTMICQNITIQLDASGNASITAADVDGGSTDNCGIASVSVSPTTFGCSDVGDNPVVLTVTDIHGNSNTCTAIVTVVDITAPVAVCQNITVELDPVTGTVTITGAEVDGGSTDACGIDTYSLDINTFDCSNIGDNTVVLTITDVNGNVSTCTAIVTVEDNTSPMLVCQDFTIEIGTDGTATLDPSDVIISNEDACGIFTIAVDITEFTCADIGTPVTVQVFSQDNNGNLSTCNAVVTTVDLLAPELTCPADQTVDPGAGNLFYIVPDYFANGEATAIDNCTDPVTLTAQTPAAGTALPDGVHTITLNAEDEYGNVSTCTFELTVMSILGAGNHNANIGSIQLYPNPAKHSIIIGNPANISLENLTIFDIRGRMVKSVDLRNMGMEKAINIFEMAAATYLVIIQSENGEITKRLIKE
ncbi:HYR domain-containing protein [Aequorivita aurantiaca]